MRAVCDLGVGRKTRTNWSFVACAAPRCPPAGASSAASPRDAPFLFFSGPAACLARVLVLRLFALSCGGAQLKVGTVPLSVARWPWLQLLLRAQLHCLRTSLLKRRSDPVPAAHLVLLWLCLTRQGEQRQPSKSLLLSD